MSRIPRIHECHPRLHAATAGGSERARFHDVGMGEVKKSDEHLKRILRKS